MKRYCDEQGIAMTPYSALASGRLAKHPGETSQRLEKDKYAKGKYDASSDLDFKNHSTCRRTCIKASWFYE